MCGIVAWVGNDSNSVRAQPIARAINRLRHRGPDQQQMYLWRPGREVRVASDAADQYGGEPFSIGLAHSRLSIIDLKDHANQPMTSIDGRYVLVFNGEIYNYRELANELRRGGATFRTESDTEVLLQALITWKEQAVSKLNGMWAFALFDREQGSLLVGRDRFGKKPLFYFHDHQQFIMASEFKAIFAILGESERRFNDKFMTEFVEGNWPTFEDHSTAYQNISTVEPGSVIQLNIEDLQLRSTPLETVEATLDRLDPNVDVAATVSSAVQLRLRSDVPTAILLSGGVDSSIVAGFARISEEYEGQIRWYTGETRFGNDPEYARDVAKTLGVELVTIDVADSIDPIELLTEMNAQYEIPVRPNGNSVAMYQMYKAMAKDGIRVVLDGTGGDEIFGGYYNLYAKNVVNDLVRRFRWTAAREFIRDCRTWEHYDDQELEQHFKRSLFSMLRLGRCTDPALSSLFQAQFNDIIRGVLPRWLYMNDQNAMAHSIEARSPLLDYRLLPLLRRPVREKFFRGYNKFALRNAMPSNISESVRWRRDKQGFRYNPVYAIRHQRPPIEELIRSSDYVREHFSEDVKNVSSIPPTRLLSLCSIAMLEVANASRRDPSFRDAA